MNFVFNVAKEKILYEATFRRTFSGTNIIIGIIFLNYNLKNIYAKSQLNCMSFSNPFVYKKEAFSTIKIFMMNFLFSLYIWMTKRSQILFYFLQI